MCGRLRDVSHMRRIRDTSVNRSRPNYLDGDATDRVYAAGPTVNGERVPRIGLGADRVEPDRARFRHVADLIQYLCDYLELNQAELAARCGIRREQLSRWFRGSTEPSVARLAAVLEPLGWAPVIALEPTTAAVYELLARAPGFDDLVAWPLRDVLATIAIAAEELRVVVGGEVAAALQGMPVRTRHMVVHVAAEDQDRLRRVVQLRRQGWEPAFEGGYPRITNFGIRVEVRVGAPLPATRIVRPRGGQFGGRAVPVVDLSALVDGEPDDPAGLGPAARAVVKAVRSPRPARS